MHSPPIKTKLPLTKQATQGKTQEIDLDSPDLYLNRELTWLEFNRRVLYEAMEQSNPLLERLKFCAIFAANLEEFFMKRMGGLKLQSAAKVSQLTVDGRTPEQQLIECSEFVNELEKLRDQALPDIQQGLAHYRIIIRHYTELSQKEQDSIRKYYVENIFPLITPQVFDPAHPFPFISNLSLNILVTLPGANAGETCIARIKVPVGAGISRFVQVSDLLVFVPLEEIIANNLDLLFPGESQFEFDYFSITRNASGERQEAGASDLLSMIELELRDRRIAPIVRIVVSSDMQDERKQLLSELLGLDSQVDVFESSGLMAQKDLFELAKLPIAELLYPSYIATTHHKLLDSQRSIFSQIRESESLLLQHPYESFSTSVVKFLDHAANDPKVRAIKVTLYRTDKETRIVDLLIQAANKGKQVTVVVEIKAKFDEAANINWAERMEEAGIHVTYGVLGLKTHCKIIMVVRQDENKLGRYVHIGTGNYHGGTARQYTDLGLLTCDAGICHDVTELFNYLTTGRASKRNYHKIIVAPKHLKKALVDKIQREIDQSKKGKKSLIQIKANALEDKDIVQALYRASMAGVKVELVIRDTCRLRPKIPRLSENISISSIVGRFLEHSRIFYFHNAGEDEYLIGSADPMQRNLESRVEVVTPIEKESLKNEIRLLLNTLLDDEQDSWEMQSDGSYIKRKITNGQTKGCQEKMMDFAHARLKKKKRQKLLKAGATRT